MDKLRQIKIVEDLEIPGKFTAFFNPLVGHPPVGRGKTWRAALANLVAYEQRSLGIGMIYVEDKNGMPFLESQIVEPKED